jgi:hypothetical protein
LLPYRRRRFPLLMGRRVTWFFVTDFNANAPSISGGSGLQARDLAVLFDSATSSVSITEVVPSGWTEIVSSVLDIGGGGASRHTRTLCSYKILASGDLTAGALNSITGLDGDGTDRKIVAVFRRSTAPSGITIGSPQEEATAGQPALQTISLGAETAPCIAFGHFRRIADAGPASAPGMTLVDGSSNLQQYAYRIFNSGQANQDVDLGDSGAWSHLQSFYLKAT